jgi:hypothetical protein
MFEYLMIVVHLIDFHLITFLSFIITCRLNQIQILHLDLLKARCRT